MLNKLGQSKQTPQTKNSSSKTILVTKLSILKLKFSSLIEIKKIWKKNPTLKNTFGVLQENQNRKMQVNSTTI